MDLSTTYLGLNLHNPLVPSASPLSHSVNTIRRMEDAGAGAVVMHSLFEEQLTQQSLELDHYLTYGAESFGEALSYFPDSESYEVGPDAYLEHIRMAKESVDIPIIGSLNGVSAGGWTAFAKQIEEAGADALELNVYYVPTEPHLTGESVEQMYVDVVSDVAKTVSIPVAVKISPFFSSIPNISLKLSEAGARGLVLFNRFFQPDLNLESLEVEPRLVLSTSEELRLPLRWIAILYGRVPVDFALTSGVHTFEDVLKGLMAGARVTMLASELLANGIGRLREILEAIRFWMDENEYESVSQMQGSMSQRHVAEPAAFERANYVRTLQSWSPDPTGKMVY